MELIEAVDFLGDEISVLNGERVGRHDAGVDVHREIRQEEDQLLARGEACILLRFIVHVERVVAIVHRDGDRPAGGEGPAGRRGLDQLPVPRRIPQRGKNRRRFRDGRTGVEQRRGRKRKQENNLLHISFRNDD